MNKIAAGLVVSALLLFTGCVGELNYSDVKKSLPAIPANRGRVFVYRPSMEGAATQTDIKFNGIVMGPAYAGGVFYFDPLPGNYKVEATSEAARPLSLALAAGQTRYVRIDTAMGYLIVRLYPELVEAGTAERELASCKLINGSP